VNSGGGLGKYFPGPMVGVALLLALLIIFTPFLTSYGQPSAGSIFSQAELVVDALPGNATLHFYVHGLGTTARYTSIAVGLAFGFPWTGGWPSGNLTWTNWTNGTDVLVVSGSTSRLPVAVNITADYISAGVSALYAGQFALNLSAASGTDTLYVASNTAGIGAFSTPVVDLPVPVTLALVSTGSAP
jgi:hypothetical protein